MVYSENMATNVSFAENVAFLLSESQPLTDSLPAEPNGSGAHVSESYPNCLQTTFPAAGTQIFGVSRRALTLIPCGFQ